MFGLSFLGILGTVGGWLFRRVTSWGLGALVPVLGSIGQFVGAIVTAIAEIIVAMAKSPEGRVGLMLIAAAFGFLYLRFHYFEQGKAEGVASVHPIVRTVQVAANCPKPKAVPAQQHKRQ
jgi:hypothetical protein